MTQHFLILLQQFLKWLNQPVTATKTCILKKRANLLAMHHALTLFKTLGANTTHQQLPTALLGYVIFFYLLHNSHLHLGAQKSFLIYVMLSVHLIVCLLTSNLAIISFVTKPNSYLSDTKIP